jgi:hypothetical protein
MKLKLFCSMLLVLLTAQSCKKAVELKNQLVDAYWGNIEGVVLQVGDQEAYVIDAGNSNLESNPAVFDINSMPYIKNIIQTGQYSYTGEVVKTTSTNGKITSISYENTTINLTEANGTLTINLSNSDASAGTWTGTSNTGGTGSNTPPVVRDTTSTLLKDAASSITITSGDLPQYPSTFTNFPVYGRYRPLSYSPGKYYYRMDAYVNSNWVLTLYFSEKPSTNKVYKSTSGLGGSLSPMDSDKVGITWVSSYEAESGKDVNVSVSGGKITVTGTNIKTHTIAGYDDYLTFKIIGQ